jgi:hypothetical protein
MRLPDCIPEVGQGCRPICVPGLLECEDGIALSLPYPFAQLLTAAYGTSSTTRHNQPRGRGAGRVPVTAPCATSSSPVMTPSLPVLSPTSIGLAAILRGVSTFNVELGSKRLELLHEFQCCAARPYTHSRATAAVRLHHRLAARDATERQRPLQRADAV